jgi:Xaa-Pro aminopeptidase
MDNYHAKVLAVVGPQLAGEDKAWLEAACAPL